MPREPEHGGDELHVVGHPVLQLVEQALLRPRRGLQAANHLGEGRDQQDVEATTVKKLSSGTMVSVPDNPKDQ